MNKNNISGYVVTDFADLAADRVGGCDADCRPALAGIDSRWLFKGSNRLTINHSGEAYQLRITRSGKLILTK
jgi:hemin uptake protein HemP